MSDAALIQTLSPVILLLLLGVASAIGSRAVRLHQIVGYILLGLVLRLAGLGQIVTGSTMSLLSTLGVMFLLFDIGLHFSLENVRKQAADIFAFGPVQVLFATVALALAGCALGVGLAPSLLLGAVLALSSTAVVGQLIAERHQQNCPVGLTATSILIFQDVAAIFLLIVAGALGQGGSIALVALLALGKAALAIAVTALLARFVIGRFLHLVAISRNEDIFTAVALLIAMAAGWATGAVGLSLTLGTFLGGLAIAGTPYRAVIQYEIKPFRGLLLGFFFIAIGLSLDIPVLLRAWPVILAVTCLLIGLKVVANVAASRVFHWSVPGSTQLGFLLAQGSEFAFVILSLAPVRQAVGEARASVVIAAVALSIAVTPSLAEAGRSLAGSLRRRAKRDLQAELTPRAAAAPVVVIGMGRVGRLMADALIAFEIGYYAVERDEARLRMAVADGYAAEFGNGADLRLWSAVDLRERRISVHTAPDLEALANTSASLVAQYPKLKRFALARDAEAARSLEAFGLRAQWQRGVPAEHTLVMAVMAELGISALRVDEWLRARAEPERVTLRAQAA